MAERHESASAAGEARRTPSQGIGQQKEKVGHARRQRLNCTRGGRERERRDANRELLSELRRVEPNGARFAVPCRRRVTVHYVSLYAATGRRAFASAPMLE